MNIAILSITNQGKMISNEIYEKLQDDPTIITLTQYHKNIKKTIKETFDTYDCIIAIMASGIIIRSIAPYINSKLTDPAVLLIDDNAKHVISLLSGHMGGANELTHKIAKLLSSEAVITTSTDVNNKIGIDVIAHNYFMNLKNTENIKYINRALVDNMKPTLKIPITCNYLDIKTLKKSYNIIYDKNSTNLHASFNEHDVILTPKSIVMGIGARKNISYDKVKNAILSACSTLNIPPERINKFATVDIKKDEQGILDAIADYSKTLEIIPKSEIEKFKNSECSTSKFVMKQFGIQGVCEPVSLISNTPTAHLIFKKTAYDGVTIAISESF